MSATSHQLVYLNENIEIDQLSERNSSQILVIENLFPISLLCSVSLKRSNMIQMRHTQI
jgi:hypothetical protein